MTTSRKVLHLPDGLSGVRYSPAAVDEDPEDNSCASGDTLGTLAYVGTMGGSPAPEAGGGGGGGGGGYSSTYYPQGRSLSSSTAVSSPPPSAFTVSSSYPYYDFQDTDDNDDSELGGGGGCEDEVLSPIPVDSLTVVPCNGGITTTTSGAHHPHYSTTSSAYNHHSHNNSGSKGSCHNNNINNNNNSGSANALKQNSLGSHYHHKAVSEKLSLDCEAASTGRYRHARTHSEARDSRDLSKSPLSRRGSRGRRPGGRGRCLCCMMCVFLLSTAGLGAVLALTYAGKVTLRAPDAPPRSTFVTHSNGGSKLDRLGEEKVIVQNCETPGCIETASAILSRMNQSAEACEDFYDYACGGYNEKTHLSWFSTRVRENPEEIVHRYREYVIDRLSSSYAKKDSPSLTKARTLFRSCLFRPTAVDERTRAIVAEVVESLGGLTMPEGSGRYDLTPLVANVTRLYGAHPFFRIHVLAPKKISITSRASYYQDLLRPAANVLSRSVDSLSQQKAAGARLTTEELLLSLLARTNYTGDLRTVVSDYLRLEARIRRTFNTDRQEELDEELTCDESQHSSFSQLQFHHGGYGINWTELVLSVLDLPTAKEVVLCDEQLSKELQHLLEITPQRSLWQFVILHSLLHSDLFLLFAGHSSLDIPGAGWTSGMSAALGGGAAKTKLESREEEMRVRSPEDQCLDLLEYVMPNLRSAIHCDKDALRASFKETDAMMEYLRQALFSIIKDLFHVSAESAWKITNTTVNAVKLDTLFYLKSLEVDHYNALKVEVDEYDFTGNVLELIKFRNQLYYVGKVHVGSFSLDMAAFGIRVCFGDSGLARPGPQIYHATVPYPVKFGSLGTYLAAKVADKLGIEDLLDHYSDGVLNHSATLGLAVRLQCFVDKYNNFKLVDYGTQIYKVNGVTNKYQIWKDQLALQMTMLAWRTFHNAMTSDRSLPGLTQSRDQLFYLAYAQNHCEKVSERGILQHYVNQDHQIPNKYRVNGPLKNLHDFYRAFHCGTSKDICDLF